MFPPLSHYQRNRKVQRHNDVNINMFLSHTRCISCGNSGTRKYYPPDEGDGGPGSIKCWWCQVIVPAPTLGQMWRWLEDRWAGATDNGNIPLNTIPKL